MKAFAILLTGLVVMSVSSSFAEDAGEVKVMSFNIRYGKAKDGDNHWSKRHNLVVKTIQNYGPDLLGTQETLKFQAEHLKQHLPHMTYLGWSRDSSEDGEQCGVLYRTDRFQLNESGQFWLSDSPETKFSKSWDSSLPRVATWANLTDKTTNNKLLFLNTHFDHKGKQARLNSASLIRDFLESQPKHLPLIVTGDFNCAEASAPYEQLLESTRVADTFRVIHPQKIANEGTFNGFTGRKTGARIDWILTSKEWNVTAAKIDDFSDNGQYPSDHFPVTTTVNVR